jgi:hypothetical protein
MPLAILAILVAITYLMTEGLLLPSLLLNSVNLPGWLLLGVAFVLLSWCLGD